MQTKIFHNRRYFLKTIGAFSVYLQFPLLVDSCTRKQKPVFQGVLPADEQKIIRTVFEILFPADTFPGIDDINAEKHLDNYLKDNNIDTAEQQYIQNGIQWTNETAQENYQQQFNDLPVLEQEKVFLQILNTPRGETWLSKLLSLIFEALLLDPVYEVNTGETGWKWLGHIPGKPRPDNNNKYPEILKRKSENTVITGIEQL